MVDIIEQMRELLTIRDRKIELQAKEIELLKKLLALKYQPKTKPEDLEPNKYCEMEESRLRDRADLETDEYPHYDELIRRP